MSARKVRLAPDEKRCARRFRPMRNASRSGGVSDGMTTGHTITTARADVHLEVRVNGTKVAETDRPVLLEETGLPTRYYLPREDVRTDLLRPTSFTTECPFKGRASYWSLDLDGTSHDGIVWSYEDPIPAAAEIAGMLSFYPDRAEVVVDG